MKFYKKRCLLIKYRIIIYKSLCFWYKLWSCMYSSCFEIPLFTTWRLFYVKYLIVVYNFTFWRFGTETECVSLIYIYIHVCARACHFRFQHEESDCFYFSKVQGPATGSCSSRSLQKQISCDQCSVINSSPLLKNSSTVTTGCIPGIGESHITLDSIITEYLTNQHALCKNPMVPCPQFNLFEWVVSF